MINAINSATPQMTFKAKSIDGIKVVDKISDTATDYLNRNRSLTEKKEIAIRKALANLNIKCPYIGIIVEKGKASIEHIKKSLGFKPKEDIAFENYKQKIEKAVKDGVIDADAAISMLNSKKTMGINDCSPCTMMI